MQTYFDNDKEWLDMIQYDLALYQAVNASLDLTIDRLGRETFQVKLQEFRQAPTLCCLWKDSGCGTTCLDELAEELSLS